MPAWHKTCVNTAHITSYLCVAEKPHFVVFGTIKQYVLTINEKFYLSFCSSTISYKYLGVVYTLWEFGWLLFCFEIGLGTVDPTFYLTDF